MQRPMAVAITCLTICRLGPYKLEVKAQGFQNYLQTGIVLQLGENVTANVAMQLGNVTQTVEVEAAAAMVETTESAVAQVINEKDVNDLPLNGRYATQLILLSGAAVTVSHAGRQAGRESARRPSAHMFSHKTPISWN